MSIFDRAEKLIHRYLDGVLTPSESGELERLLSDSPEVARLFASMSRLDFAIENCANVTADGGKNPRMSTDAPPRRAGRFRRWIWAAAVVLSFLPSVLTYLVIVPSAKAMEMGFSLTAIKTDDDNVRLAWRDFVNNEEGFQIEKSANDVEYTEIARVGAGVTEYIDHSLRMSNLSFYRIRAFNAAGASEYSDSVGIVTAPQSLINISARGYVAKEPRVLIAGIIITGTEEKKVLIRALGPTLADAGVSDALADPMLSLYVGQKVVAQNNDWQVYDDMGERNGYRCGRPEEIKATGMAPGRSPLRRNSGRESAILVTLRPGMYTACVQGVDNSEGMAIVEVIEVK